MSASTSNPKSTKSAPESGERGWIHSLLRWETLLVALILIVGFVNSQLSPFFLRTDNLLRASRDYVEIGLMMLTMVFVIITAGIDLAVASTLGMTASFMGWLFNAGVNIWVAAAAALVLGIAAGAFNGYLIARIKLPPLVVTLGTFALYRGIAYTLLQDNAARGYPPSFTWLGQGRIGTMGIPVPLVLFAIMALIFGLLLHKTAFGRMTYAIGNNEEASRYAGVPVARVKWTIYTLSGLMGALAGLVLAARFGSTRPDIGTGLELDVITATVLGGVSISGGSGTMVGALLSLLLIGELKFGMGLLNVQGQVQGIVIGVLLIAAILLPNLVRQFTRRQMRVTGGGLIAAAICVLAFVGFAWFFLYTQALFLAT